MFATSFNLEQTPYAALYSRDCNNYLAVKPDGSHKGKGVFAGTGLMKDPAGSIIQRAVRDKLLKDIDIEWTVYNCTDIREFVIARNCTGGGIWRGGYWGKTLRWIWSSTGEPIYSALSGNKVANSDGAYLVMQLPGSVPRWTDYDKYIQAANKLMNDVGM